jgi:hypothetical protein
MASWLDGTNLRAKTPARCGVARCGATRIGFAPTEADDILADGTLRYVWRQDEGPQGLDPATTWTTGTEIGDD